MAAERLVLANADLLIDESLPRELKRHFPDHRVTTVPERGWASLSNGELLRLASAEYDAFLTADQNIEHPQSLPRHGITIVILVAPSNRPFVYPLPATS